MKVYVVHDYDEPLAVYSRQEPADAYAEQEDAHVSGPQRTTQAPESTTL